MQHTAKPSINFIKKVQCQELRLFDGTRRTVSALGVGSHGVPEPTEGGPVGGGAGGGERGGRRTWEGNTLQQTNIPQLSHSWLAPVGTGAVSTASSAARHSMPIKTAPQ